MSYSLDDYQENRRNQRFQMNNPVFIRSFVSSHKKIKLHTLTDNISQGGFYFQSPVELQLGSYLFSYVELFNGAFLAARGNVIRMEETDHGLYGMAVNFKRYRLITNSN